MSCCGNHNHNNHQKGQHGQHDHHGGKNNSHKWMMIICVLPIALAAIFFLTKGFNGSVSNYVPLFLLLLCPLSHLVMMPLMNKKRGNHNTK